MKSPLFFAAGLLLLLSGSAWAQRPLTPLKNPDRGWHLESISAIVNPDGSLKDPSDLNVSFNMAQLTESCENYVKKHLGESQHLTLSQSYIYLTNFVGKRISDQALATIDNLFQAHRSRGVKMILRFAYDYQAGLVNARYTDINRHLDQLAPIIQKNAGVIHTWQAGMLGAWGEWHDTERKDINGTKLYDLLDSPDSMRVMIRKMLDIVPVGGTVQVRIPYWRELFAFEDGLMQRIGLHNDGFTAGAYQFAPGNDYVNQYYIAAQKCSPFVPVGGEMPFDGPGNAWNFNDTISVSKALVTLRDHHYTSLDISQNTPLNIRRWTTYNLTADSLNTIGIPFHPEYFKDNGITVPRTMFQFVRDHFGYNLYFDYDKDVIQSAAGKVSFSIPFRNYGFSRIYNRYKVVAYLLNDAGEKLAEAPLDANPADWHPFRPGDSPTSRMQHYLQGAIPLPASLAAGSYKIGFGILPLSPDVAGDTAFCIRFANRSNLKYVTTTDKKVINVSHTFSYNTTARYCVPTSDAGGQERYFTKLWSEGAMQNIDLTTPLKPTNAYAIADQTIRGKQGSSFKLNAVTTNDSKYSLIRAWVDWNGDGIFSDNQTEMAFVVGDSNPTVDNGALLENFARSINIPANAKVGNTVMRIRFCGAWENNPGPCGYQIQNTTFDFPVYVDTTTAHSPATPAYCTASGDGTADTRYPTTLRTQNAPHNLNIAAPLLPQNGYRQYTADYLSVSPGTTFDLIGTSSDQAKASQVRAWADWNGDGIFADDASEILFDLGKHAPAAVDSAAHNAAIRNFSQSVFVPATVKLGPTRIRIRYFDAWESYPGSCGNAAKSTTFDFVVKVETPEGGAYCLAGSDGHDQDRYLTSLSTSGASRNIMVPAASLTPVNAYQVYRDDAVTVTPGSSFSLAGTATPGTRFNQISLWIDWDGSGSFESSESIFTLGIRNANDNGPAVLNFNQPVSVPLTTRPGTVRARIRNHNSWYSVPDPCGDAPGTTTFDFLINVQGTVSCKPETDNAGFAPNVYPTTLSTSGAAHNLNIVAELKPVRGYRQYENDVLVVNAGSTFNLHTTGSETTRFAQMRAWIDWNGDGVFDDGGGEDLFALGKFHAEDDNYDVQDFLKTIAVPATAKSGYTRLRLRYWNSWTSYPGPCNAASESSLFDFPILILGSGAIVCKPETDETTYAPNVFLTSLSTSGAAHNLTMTSELKPQRGYRLYDNDILAISAGSTFDLHATTSEETKWAQMRAWIDWNGDGIFEDGVGEDLFSIGTYHSDGTSTAIRDFLKSINVPATAKAGYTRLRLRFWNSWVAYPGSCNYLDKSATFDVTVQILPSGAAACKPETDSTIYAPFISLTSLSTSGAKHNLNITSELRLKRGYRKYENDVLTVNAGSSFSLHGTTGDAAKFSQIRAWIDWNGDGTFTDGGNEELFVLGDFHSDGNNSPLLDFLKTINAPATAKPGYTRLRLRYWNSWVAYPGACGQSSQSGTFDFDVLVLPSGSATCKPETNVTSYAPLISLTSLSTSGALHNLNSASELKLQRGYRLYDNEVLAVTAGSSFSLNGTANEATNFSQMRAWADWNGDGAFSDGSNEDLFALGEFHSDGTNPVVRSYLKTVNVPATANPGYTRLRLRYWNSWLAYPGPCNYHDQSGTFDFIVLVLPAGTTTYSLPVSSYREAAPAPAEAKALTGVLYPSPVGQKPLHVLINRQISGKAEMELLDVSGRSMAKQEAILRNGLLEEDVRNLKPGLYFLVLKVDNTTLTFRFVKE
ncbi:GEVED domain-containing protein [Siphonobacter aquaeclarae]|uniref:Por secretion system C-terminal sorting domain-containing protein n=1 Tax=Siphonobacter aquaeclarae TaxID=563176 RepID=A0A1G9IPW3_9BACT|nr:GEVED domain-containing protein [Siphonobacter aquaeclarae]SDL27298.1 Por secretion system C-terminal sorting domain-containing protein [Siphonobacter aquaeclarae]